MSEPTTPQPPTPPKGTQAPRGQSGRAAKKTSATRSRPANDDREGWKAYWAAQGQPWRTEPEIDEERQKFLDERRAITPNIEKGIYPFKAMKLSRADVEWLLVTHKDRGLYGPAYLEDPRQRDRTGLDLRGVDLVQADLSGLPLTKMLGGLPFPHPALDVLRRQREMAGAHLEEALLYKTHLEGAILYHVHLEGASLREVSLGGAVLVSAHLERANLFQAHFEGKLFPADTQSYPLQPIPTISASLPPADLRRVFFDAETNLRRITLGDKLLGYSLLVDVRWGGVNLAVVDWTEVILEWAPLPRRNKTPASDWRSHLEAYQAVVRGNRQLAIVLRNQGLNEEADRFAYRAQVLQRVVFWHQRLFHKYLGSWLLWLIAGYGYRPLRSLVIYLILLCGFATAYFFLGPTVGVPFSPLGAIVFSVTSFHGRGFFPGAVLGTVSRWMIR